MRGIGMPADLRGKNARHQGAQRGERRQALDPAGAARRGLAIEHAQRRRAQLAFQSTERLAAKGIVTALQLEGDQFAVEKAKNL